MRKRDVFQDVDWITILLYLLLVGIGWLSIYSANFDDTNTELFNLNKNYGRQLLWMATSLIIAFIILIIDSKFFDAFSYIFYGFLILLLIFTLFFAPEIKGSKSWFVIGDFKLQTSEFAKFTTNLVLAKFLSTLNINLKDLKTKLIAFAIFLVPMLLTLLQGDTGTALVFIAFLFVLYREGMHPFLLVFGICTTFLAILALLINQYYIIIGLTSIAGMLIYFVRKNRQAILVILGILLLSSALVFAVEFVFNDVLKPHQKQRIEVLLGKEGDAKGAAYNVNQSKIAIGSGGFWGKGFLQGTQTKFNFVPEQSTDFIFCTIGEEWGFSGSVIVLLLFMALLMRIIFIAERQRSKFSRIYAYGVASILFFHVLINIGMTIGLVPVIGIPLPFISYGGSSLWGFTILLFILVKADADRMQILR